MEIGAAQAKSIDQYRAEQMVRSSNLTTCAAVLVASGNVIQNIT